MYYWRDQAAAQGLGDGDIFQALLLAQNKADAYLACLERLNAGELQGEELNEAVDTCAEQAGW